MKKGFKNIYPALFLALGLALGVSKAGASSPPAQALLEEAAGAATNDAPRVAFLRKRYVRLQTSLLDGLAGRFRRPGWDPGFRLDLFGDVQAGLSLERLWACPGGGWAGWGKLTGAAGGRVLLAYRGGVLEADAWVPGHNRIEVRYVGGGLHRVSEVDSKPGQIDLDEGAPAAGPTAAEWTAGQGVPTFYPQDVRSGCPNSLNLKVSQIMVLYTPLAAQEAGGTTAMETLIDLAWAGMNMAFYNSGVTAQMQLVHTQEVNYTETGNVGTDLANFSNPSLFPQLAGLMATYGAHYVSLFVGKPGPAVGGGMTVGVGYLPGFQTVLYYPYADIAFPHEVGHNLGCHHDRQTDGVPSGNGSSYGYRFTAGGNTFITIMAYQPGNWILNYSNPNILFQGQPTGVDPASSTGADNALQINRAFPDTPYTASNQLPSVQVSAPADGTYLSSLAPVTLAVSASDADGTVAQVDFYVNDLYAGTAVSAPYTITWTPPAPGTYYVSATAVDNQGGMKVSCPNALYVTVPTATATDTFTVTLTPTITSTPTITATPAPPPPCCADGNSLITAFAGNGTTSYSGDGGPATLASLIDPRGLYCDPSGNLFICDAGAIRKVSPSGVISTAVSVASATGVAGDAAGNLYIGLTSNFQVLKASPAGVTSVFAGRSPGGYGGDGGPAVNALFNYAFGVAVDAAGNVYIADSGNNRIRKVNASGIITTFAGNGYGAGAGTGGFSGDGGPATLAELNYPEGVAVDPSGNVYFFDSNNYRIRKVDTNGIITTAVGNGTDGFSGDGGLAVSAEIGGVGGILPGIVFCGGSLYFSDHSNNRIRKVDPSGIITTIAGNGTQSSTGNGGPASLASVQFPQGLAVDGHGNLCEAEEGWTSGFSDVVRKLVPCPPTATATPTSTSTDTSTPSATGTPAATATDSPTGTLTPAPTSTPTDTPTLTATSTSTATATPTGTLPTATPTGQVISDTFPTFTPTSSPTASPTDSPTSSATPTATGTATPTPTSTDSPTPSPTGTPSTTATPSETSTGTFTPTGTLSPVPTSTPTFTPTLTATPTATDSISPTPTGTGIWTDTPTVTSTGTKTPTPGTTPPRAPVLFPNPVTGPGGRVELHLPCGGDVEVDLFTTAFRRVLRKDFPRQPAGVELTLDLADGRGEPLANGLYYVAVRAQGKRWIGKLLVLR